MTYVTFEINYILISYFFLQTFSAPQDQNKLVYMTLLESFRERPRAILTAKFLQEFHNSYGIKGTGNTYPIVLEFEVF